jgi:hypothetical protein
MERNPQRGRIQRAAELFHIQRMLVVYGDDALSRIDGFADGIRQLVGQPTVRRETSGMIRLLRLDYLVLSYHPLATDRSAARARSP